VTLPGQLGTSLQQLCSVPWFSWNQGKASERVVEFRQEQGVVFVIFSAEPFLGYFGGANLAVWR
jgi:hypothetical protein